MELPYVFYVASSALLEKTFMGKKIKKRPQSNQWNKLYSC